MKRKAHGGIYRNMSRLRATRNATIRPHRQLLSVSLKGYQIPSYVKLCQQTFPRRVKRQLRAPDNLQDVCRRLSDPFVPKQGRDMCIQQVFHSTPPNNSTISVLPIWSKSLGTSYHILVFTQTYVYDITQIFRYRMGLIWRRIYLLMSSF